MKRHHEIYEDEKFFVEFIHLAINACNDDILVKQHFRYVEISVQ